MTTRYLRTQELLGLQTPAGELVVPDELLFQILHQTQELWLKCAAFETAILVEKLDGEAIFGALAALDRIVLITRSLGEQMRVMFTLAPSRFHVIRRSLGNGSGLESPGYNQMLAAAEAALGALERLVTQRGTTLLAIYRDSDSHPDLYHVLERFVDWDTAVQSWLVEHFMLVRRTLGVDRTVPALDGFPTVALGARMTRPLFPELWNVRRAREVGALVALDAYQSVGAAPVDVAALDADFVLGGAHKWLCGSYESAFLYVRPSLVQNLEPAATGWIASADPLSFATPTGWAGNARRFAGGTPAVLPSLMSRPGLAIVREIGIATIRSLSLARTDRVIMRADEAGLGVATPRPHDRRGGIVALRFPGDALVARRLIANGFVCSYRGGIRIAPHFYNTDEEIDRFMDDLVRLARAAS